MSTGQASSNTGDFFGVRVSAPGINVNQASGTQLLYENNYNTEVFFNNGTPQILIGQLPDGSYGMQVSSPGQDVTAASSPEQFTFNSNFPSLIAPRSGVISIPGLGAQPGSSNGVQAATPIAHGLGYVPSLIAFCFGPVFIGSGPVIKFLNSPVPVTFLDSNLTSYQLSVGTDSEFIYAYNNWLTDTGGAIPSFNVTYYLLNVTA